jgi:hypothetical protein
MDSVIATKHDHQPLLDSATRSSKTCQSQDSGVVDKLAEQTGVSCLPDPTISLVQVSTVRGKHISYHAGRLLPDEKAGCRPLPMTLRVQR